LGGPIAHLRYFHAEYIAIARRRWLDEPTCADLVAFAYGLQALGGTDAGWLHGLKIVAVAAQAVWGMAKR
jgi:chromate transport protein ChrA